MLLFAQFKSGLLSVCTCGASTVTSPDIPRLRIAQQRASARSRCLDAADFGSKAKERHVHSHGILSCSVFSFVQYGCRLQQNIPPKLWSSQPRAST
ncbi:hypothetical protein LSAT2_005380 [Lamellibrachia satsuma]|nr:hypothetical protein LSAT2_005380 [Lamellibrachia satsuma]